MPIDPLLKPILEQYNNLPDPEKVHMQLTEWRDASHSGLSELALRYCDTAPPLALEYDDFIVLSDREIPLRVYLPHKRAMLPVHIYLHGGGWWLGDRNS